MDTTNRIIKDTSARKNTSKDRMHSAIEVAAIKAAHEAYLSTIITGYESKLESIQADHEAETAELKTAHGKEKVQWEEEHAGLKTAHGSEKTQWEEKHRTVATEAARRAFAARDAEIAQLKKIVAAKEGEIGELKLDVVMIQGLKTELTKLKTQDIPRVADLEAQLKTLRREKSDLTTQLAQADNLSKAAVLNATRTKDSKIQEQSNRVSIYQKNIATMKDSHAKEIAVLKKKLEVSPNSWVEFAVTGKGRKRRTYVRRQHATFKEALSEFAKDVNRDIYFMQFEHKGNRISGSETKTIEQLGIKDGDEVRMHGG